MQFDFSTKQVAMLEGTLLPSNMATKTTFCLYLVKRLILTLRCAVNATTISLMFKCNISVQKETVRSFKKMTSWSGDQLRTNSFQENGAGF